MRLKIIGITDRVFPKPSLPNALFATRNLAGRGRACRAAVLRKPRLDLFPPDREIRIIRRQRPDRMDVVGQDHHRVTGNGMFTRHRCIDGPQQINLVHQSGGRPIRKRDGKEIGPTRNIKATIARHGATIGKNG
jgi:hypothetical protein